MPRRARLAASPCWIPIPMGPIPAPRVSMIDRAQVRCSLAPSSVATSSLDLSIAEVARLRFTYESSASKLPGRIDNLSQPFSASGSSTSRPLPTSPETLVPEVVPKPTRVSDRPPRHRARTTMHSGGGAAMMKSDTLAQLLDPPHTSTLFAAQRRLGP